MQYTYEVYQKGSGVRVHTCSRIDDINNDYCNFNQYWVEVQNNIDKENFAIVTIEEWIEWQDKLARDFAWKPSKVMDKQPIETANKENPFIDELPEKGKLYFVEDDGFHSISKNVSKEGIEKANKEHYEKYKGQVRVGYNKGVEDTNVKEKVNSNPCSEFQTATSLTIEEYMCEHKKDPINPPHYQGFFEQYQWLETMCRLGRFANNPEGFEAAVELQVRKYLDRFGKDSRLQELEKALWYLKFLTAFIKNGRKPIFVKDVDDILSKE
jgi:hypothetical protein